MKKIISTLLICVCLLQTVAHAESVLPKMGMGQEGLMPSTGDVRILVLVLAFQDYPLSETDVEYTRLQDIYFAEDDPTKSITDISVRAAYQRHSYGKLNITGDILPIYTASKNRSEYDTMAAYNALIGEALAYHFDGNPDRNYADYDSDGDGYLDCFAVRFAGPHGASNTQFYSGYCTGAKTIPISHDRIRLGYRTNVNTFNAAARTDIHEFGHAMGLLDNITGNRCVIDITQEEIMSSRWYYFNMFYKYILKWVEPVILTADDPVREIKLYATERYGGAANTETKAVLFIPENKDLPYTQYYIIEYRQAGLGSFNLNDNPGVTVWKCKGELPTSGKSHTFLHNDYIVSMKPSGGEKFSAADLFVPPGTTYSEHSKFKVEDVTSTFDSLSMEVVSFSDDMSYVTLNAGFLNAPADMAPPTATVAYSPAALTSGDVAATVTFSEPVTVTTGSNNLTQTDNELVYTATFTANGSFDVEFENLAGTAGEKLTLSVDWIDKAAPVGTVSYSTQSPTNQDVTATLSVDAGITITNNGGSNTYSFAENGTFTFELVNQAGTTGSVTAEVTWIDKTVPTATVSYSTTNPTNGSVTATITPSKDVTVTNNGGSFSYTFSANGSFTFEFEDAAGNTGSVTATVDWIDTSFPAGSMSYSTNTLTNQNVTATLSVDAGITITNNSGSNTYSFTENGAFTFELVNQAGTTGSVTAEVTWIDKTVPTATVSYSTTNPTNGSVTATISPSKDVTVTNNGGSLSYTFTENGSFTFEFEDAAGNTGSVTATVTWIKAPDPVGPSTGGNNGGGITKPIPEPETESPVVEPPTDVSGHWAEAEIAAVIESGLMQGYPNGTFAPEQSLTRAELAAILCRYLGIEPKDTQGYADTQDHWASDYIAVLTELGILTGYDDGLFHPDREVTREEIAVILDRALNRASDASGSSYMDGSQISEWARQAVSNTTAQGWLKGYLDESFKPQNEATRAEIATVFTRLIM